MISKINPVVLPVFYDREFNALFVNQTKDLATRLRATVAKWQRETNDPSGHSVGAAFYAALWDYSESVAPESKASIRRACAMTLLSNDKETQLALAPIISPFPN